MESSGRVELPAAFEDAHINNLAILIADMLERLMVHNDQIPLLPESLTRFHSRSAPSITVLEYLKRIVKFTNVEKSCLLITLHYIDQICARMPLFTLSSLTCHRFIIASITVSSKGLCDVFCTNNLYAKVGGIPVTELNLLEREFLQAIDWHLTCTREILQEYYTNLVRTHSTGQFILTGSLQRSARSISSSPSDSSDIEIVDNTNNINTDDDDDGDQALLTAVTTIESPTSRPTSPTLGGHIRAPTRRHSVSSHDVVMVDPTQEMTSRRPTIEQNMAFAALQESLRRRGRSDRQS